MYIDYIQVNLPILETLLSSFMLNNISFFFCPNFRTLSIRVKDNKIYFFILFFYFIFILSLWTKD